MNILNLNFKISDEEISALKIPIKTVQQQIQKKWIEFRELVCKEIIKETNRNPSLIKFVRYSEWPVYYSQVYYDGIFQGHLFEDPISFNFRFDPTDRKDCPKPSEKRFL